MTTPDDSHGAQPGDQQDAPHGEQPNGATSVSDLSEDQLLELITSEGTENSDDLPEDEGAQPDDPPEAAEQQQAEAKPPGRLSVKALPPAQQLEMAKAIEMVRNGESADVFDAMASLRSANAPQAEADADPPAETTPPASPAKSPEVATIEAELTALRAQRKAAKDEFDGDLEDSLTTRIEETLMRLHEVKTEAKLEAQRATLAQNDWQSRYNAAVDELETRYPDTLDDDSEFSTLLSDLMAAAQARKDPAAADPRFILTQAERVAGLLTPPPSGRPPSAPPPAPRPTGRGLAPAHSAVNRPTADQVAAMINEADPDDLLAALAAT